MKLSMKALKQSISFILIIVLVTALIPSQAFTQDPDDLPTNEIETEEPNPTPDDAEEDRELIDEELTVSNIPDELLEATDIDVENIKGLDDMDSANLYSVTTINEDDSRTLHIFNTPVKYYDKEDDKIKFIDNTLTKSDKKSIKNGTYAFENAANSVKTYLPKTSDEYIVLRYESGSFRFYLQAQAGRHRHKEWEK
jgi:hypothetical protein